MTCTLVIGVIAAEEESHDVTVTVTTEAVATVYSVDVTWGSLTFEYWDRADTWNESAHKYNSVADGWKSGDSVVDELTATITVKNHTNKAVTVTPSYTPADNGVSVELSGAINLDSATEHLNDYDAADSDTITITVSGAPTDKSQASQVVGSINLTIN